MFFLPQTSFLAFSASVAFSSKTSPNVPYIEMPLLCLEMISSIVVKLGKPDFTTRLRVHYFYLFLRLSLTKVLPQFLSDYFSAKRLSYKLQRFKLNTLYKFQLITFWQTFLINYIRNITFAVWYFLFLWFFFFCP